MTSEDDGRGNDDREEMELDITSLVCSGGQFNAMLRFLIAQRPVPSSLTTYYDQNYLLPAMRTWTAGLGACMMYFYSILIT